MDNYRGWKGTGPVKCFTDQLMHFEISKKSVGDSKVTVLRVLTGFC